MSDKLQVKAATVLPLHELARSKQTQSTRGTVLSIYVPPPASRGEKQLMHTERRQFRVNWTENKVKARAAYQQRRKAMDGD